jgi:DNA invertase Pin-like site-specific DNA recombinase
MPVIGYGRVNTTDQNLELQGNALRAAGCDIIRSEKRSVLRKGDVLMVTRIDRLARQHWRLTFLIRLR